MMIKAVPIRRVKGPLFRTGAWQAFFCHACAASMMVSKCMGMVIRGGETYTMIP
jgi:hypothetical protein